MNETGIIVGCLIAVFLTGLWTGHTIWGQDAPQKSVETPPNTIQCIAGPHPQNPEYVQLECEIRQGAST